jgi:hypothetical protein
VSDDPIERETRPASAWSAVGQMEDVCAMIAY